MEFVTKKCPSCGADLDLDIELEIAQCSYCDSMLHVKQTPMNSDTYMAYVENVIRNEKKASRTKPIVVVLATLGGLAILFVSCGLLGVFDEPEPAVRSDGSASLIADWDWEEDLFPAPDEPIGLGDTFTFDGFEITIGEISDWTVVDRLTEMPPHGESVFRLPVEFTNIGDETRAMHWGRMRMIGSQGMQLEMVQQWFPDGDSAHQVGQIRPGIVVSDRYHYILYDGDGYYELVFSTFGSPTITVRFYVEK